MALRMLAGTWLLSMVSMAAAGSNATDLDTRLATAKRQITAMRYDLRTAPRERSAAFRELFATHVMTIAELDAMQARVGQVETMAKRRQHVEAGALLDQFDNQLTRAHDLHSAMHRYFTDAPEIEIRLNHWRNFARANSLDADHSHDVERLARDLQDAVHRGEFPVAATDVLPALRRAVDQAVARGWITAWEREGAPIRSAPRTKACSRAADTRRGYGLPPAGLARVPPVLDLDQTRFKRGARVLQPAEARHVVGLELQLDAEGCVLEASVRVSSGSATHDSEALSWILNDANIEPAYLDGRAVSARFRMELGVY